MALVGYHDLQARSAYQPTIQQQGNRWIAYLVSGRPGWRVPRMTEVARIGELKARLREYSFSVPVQTPEEMARALAEDSRIDFEIIKAGNVKIE